MPLNGKSGSKQLRYLLDNDLSPDIAAGLRLFGFQIIHIKDALDLGIQLNLEPQASGDPDVIRWCKANQHVFITHDYSARKQHEADMKAAAIHVLWIRGHPERAATWLFFKTLVRAWDQLEKMLQSSHGAMHFKIGLQTASTPEVIWTQKSCDMPRRERPMSQKAKRQ